MRYLCESIGVGDRDVTIEPGGGNEVELL